MKADRKAVEKARELIDANQYVLDSSWSDAQPSPGEENDFLDRNGYDQLSCWYLGVHEDESDKTKAKLGFPYGDFRRVHRSGLIAAKQRAAQQGYDSVEKAADDLLQHLDDVRGD
ncbi:MAG: hypothetical protein AAGK78_02175 [Planctomycetota bacterium]